MSSIENLKNKVLDEIFTEIENCGYVNLLNESFDELYSKRQKDKLEIDNGDLYLKDIEFTFKNEIPEYIGVFENDYGSLLFAVKLNLDATISEEEDYKIQIHRQKIASKG